MMDYDDEIPPKPEPEVTASDAPVLEMLSDEECYLATILQDASGLDLAEFAWHDPSYDDGCFRAWPFQWSWWRNESPLQVDQCGRSVGKSLGVKVRSFSFPFVFPNQEMVITAPELVHLEPIVGLVEGQFYNCRLGREMLMRGRSAVTHRPFMMNFANGARLIGRIPQRDGRGVKGIHPLRLELDEAQDYPRAGWTELTETLKRGFEGAQWRAHGVTRGVRDKFFEFTKDTPDNDWKVHRITAISRPNWTDEERQEKIKQYGGREDPDYRRNVLGMHGDATNPLFVLHRLLRCADSDETSMYNTDEYWHVDIKDTDLEYTGDEIEARLDPPASHTARYTAFWLGMDVGFTADPSEILVFTEYQPDAAELKADKAAKRAVPRDGLSRVRCIGRITLKRIGHPLQVRVILHLIDHYNPKAFALDKMQPVSEPVLTPMGWVPIGSLSVGDEVIGSDGKPTKVIGVYPQVDRRVMRVTCNDGSWTRCGPEHLWTVRHINQDVPVTLTTEQLAFLINSQTVPPSLKSRQRRWRLPMLSAPVEFSRSDLPVDPYLLGLLLGDGNLRPNGIRFSTADEEILLEIERRLPDGMIIKHVDRYDYTIIAATGWRQHRAADGTFMHANVLLRSLRSMGLAGLHSHEKFVPAEYLLASPTDRLAILQGIMDTDGWVTPCGNSSCTVAIRLSSERLLNDVISLVESLGGSARYRTHPTSCNGKPGRQAHMATIALPSHLSPFLLSRKRDRVMPRTHPVGRLIDSIKPDGEEDSVCIRVEARDHLYVTRHHLLTHNTGNGLPLFQDVQDRIRKAADATASRRARAALDAIKGYNFSEKVLVDFDEAIEAASESMDPEERAKEAGISRNVLEFSTDKLRELVDNGQLMLPWDRELIGEFQGQTFSYSKATMDLYGRRRRIFSEGKFHALDAARMAVMGLVQHPIEEIMGRKDDPSPVFDIFGL